MLADDLAKAQICERDGILYAAGVVDGQVRFEWSQDGGATKALFPDASTSRLVASEAVDDEQPAIEALETGEVVVACSQNATVRTYVTRDEGGALGAGGRRGVGTRDRRLPRQGPEPMDGECTSGSLGLLTSVNL